MTGLFHTLEWVRAAADTVFLVAGVVPLVFATLRITLARRASPESPIEGDAG